MSQQEEKIARLASKLVHEAMGAGLHWDDAVAAFGLAAKLAARTAAALGGPLTVEDLEALARDRFEEAFAQKVQVVVAMSDMSQLREAYKDVDADALLANCNVKAFKLH